MDPSLPLHSGNVAAYARTAVDAGQPEAMRTAARKAAEEFEAVFLTTMLEGMFSGLETDGPFGGGSGEKTYRSLLTGEYAKQLAGSGGLGIADHVYRELLAAQESASK